MCLIDSTGKVCAVFNRNEAQLYQLHRVLLPIPETEMKQLSISVWKTVASVISQKRRRNALAMLYDQSGGVFSTK